MFAWPTEFSIEWATRCGFCGSAATQPRQLTCRASGSRESPFSASRETSLREKRPSLSHPCRRSRASEQGHSSGGGRDAEGGGDGEGEGDRSPRSIIRNRRSSPSPPSSSTTCTGVHRARSRSPTSATSAPSAALQAGEIHTSVAGMIGMPAMQNTCTHLRKPRRYARDRRAGLQSGPPGAGNTRARSPVHASFTLSRQALPVSRPRQEKSSRLVSSFRTGASARAAERV